MGYKAVASAQIRVKSVTEEEAIANRETLTDMVRDFANLLYETFGLDLEYDLSYRTVGDSNNVSGDDAG